MPYVSRRDLQLTPQETEEFLRANTWGRLATASLAAEPHVTPLGFVFYDGALWIHGLRRSRRGRHLAENPKVAFLVDDGVAEGQAYTERRGAIVYGRCVVANDDPRMEAARAAYMESFGMRSVDEIQRRTHDWYRIDIDRISSWDFRKIPAGVDRKA
jgi:nitroimidazol reductase NimA-like FMN-containing flavoprotein (pyridoxamine 5'-phosphate oxidase superfamily)